MDEENKGEFSERPEVTPAESVILPVQKKSKVTTILCIVLAIAVIGLGAYILCDKVLNKEETKKEPDTAEKTEEEEKVDKYAREEKLQEIMEALRTKLNSIFGDGYNIATITLNEYNMGVRIDKDSNLLTKPEKSYSVMIPDLTNEAERNKILDRTTKVRNDMSSVWEKYGFKEIEALQYAIWGAAYYESEDGFACSADMENSIPYVISCGDTKDVSEEKQTFVKALAKAYTDKTGTKDVGYLDAKKEDIKNSGVDSYQNIYASGANAAEIFYRKSADDDWQYFTGTQGVLLCDEDFNTTELKKAFNGTACWDTKTNKQTTVKAE